MGDRCSKEFFRSVRPKNTQAVILELKEQYGRNFTKREDLERICQYFYKDLYTHKNISEEVLTRTLEGLPATVTNAMNESISKKITVKELSQVVNSLAKGKAPGHDGIPMEFFQKMWHTIIKDLHLMILKGIEEKQLHENMTKGLICFIPKEGDTKALNYWRLITFLPVMYKIFAKALQIRLQLMPKDIISPEQTPFFIKIYTKQHNPNPRNTTLG